MRARARRFAAADSRADPRRQQVADIGGSPHARARYVRWNWPGAATPPFAVPPRTRALPREVTDRCSRQTAAIDVHSLMAIRGEARMSDSRAVNRLAEEVLRPHRAQAARRARATGALKYGQARESSHRGSRWKPRWPAADHGPVQSDRIQLRAQQRLQGDRHPRTRQPAAAVRQRRGRPAQHGSVPGRLHRSAEIAVQRCSRSRSGQRARRGHLRLLEIDRDLHAPPPVRFNWGPCEFFAVIEKLGRKVTMFHPDGTPARATLSVSFKEYRTLRQQLEDPRRESADKTQAPRRSRPRTDCGASPLANTTIRRVGPHRRSERPRRPARDPARRLAWCCLRWRIQVELATYAERYRDFYAPHSPCALAAPISCATSSSPSRRSKSIWSSAPRAASASPFPIATARSSMHSRPAAAQDLLNVLTFGAEVEIYMGYGDAQSTPICLERHDHGDHHQLPRRRHRPNSPSPATTTASR